MENNKYILPLAIIVAGVLVAGAIYLGGSSQPTDISTAPEVTNQEKIVIPKVSAEDHVLGDLNLAEVVVIEYSDTECPWCKVFHETMIKVVSDYNGKVAWIYRHMPFHNKSIKEAQATECAAEIGGNQAFWNYINKLYEITPSNDGLDLAELPKIAEGLSLNTTSFNECLNSDRHTQSIQDNLKLSGLNKIEGTPYSVIRSMSGQEIEMKGAGSIEMVKANIDSLIQN